MSTNPTSSDPTEPKHIGIFEWLTFSTAISSALLTFQGDLRSTGPLLLLLLAPLLAQQGLATVSRTIARVVILFLALAGSFTLDASPVWAVVGRHVLVSGLVIVSVDLLPRSVVRRLVQFSRFLSARPNGPLAALFAFAVVAVPSAVMFLNTRLVRCSGDTLPVVATVYRMLYHGDRDLTEFHLKHPGRWGVFVDWNHNPYNMIPSDHHPGFFSAYPAGMEAFAWPGALLAESAGSDLSHEKVQEIVEYRTAAIISALSLALFFLAALHLADAISALMVTLALATGSTYLSTFSQVLWQQAGVAIWSVVILYVELRSRGRPRGIAIVIQGVACGLMLACRPSAGLFLVPFGIWVLTRDWKRGLAVPLIALLAYSPFAYTYWHLHRSYVGPSIILTNGIGWPTWEGWLGILVSPARGLFVYQPFFLLLPLALLTPFRSPWLSQLGYYPFMLIFLLLHSLLIGGWIMWWGGHSIGSRLVGEVVPTIALATVPIVARIGRSDIGRLGLGCVVALGFFLHYSPTYRNGHDWNNDPRSVDEYRERLWDWSDPPFLYFK